MFGLRFVLITVCFALVESNASQHRYGGHIRKTGENYETIIALANIYTKPNLGSNDVVATGFWDENYNVTGWSVLEIESAGNYTNIDQVYAVGLLEGQFTRELTNMQWQNTIADICVYLKGLCPKLKDFFQTQLNWIYAQIDSNPNDEYWHQINLTLIQLNGLIDGYENKTRGPRNQIDDPLGFYLFQEQTSFYDIAIHLGFPNISRQDHCSALIKILPNNTDVFVSHANWGDYTAMLRILKRYTMPLKRTPTNNNTYLGDIVPGYDLIFSSYPGTLQSVDDFYMTRPANLTILETTIDIYNDDLYRNLQVTSVPEWIRVIVANRLANSGREWVDKFFMYNDGTYNNEWMLIDMKQFTRGQQPRSGFLTVAEQMTTYYESVDMTDTLNKNSYWASYNNIYFDKFRNISGEEDMVKQRGPALYSWQNSSRARIFRRDHHQIVDLPTMIHMMRYNDFRHDEFSKCNCTPPYSAILTIAARCDLNDINGTYPERALGYRCNGATDAKITSYELMQEFSLVAISGPTTDQQPPFVWSQSICGAKLPHFGQPDQWNFEPFKLTWK